MLTVWKFPIPITDTTIVEMPVGAEVLHVGEQDNTLCIWALCTSNNGKEPRKFIIRGTGHPVLSMHKYLGTVSMPPFVWHVFEANR